MNPSAQNIKTLQEKFLEAFKRWTSYNSHQNCHLHLTQIACLLHSVGYKIRKLDSVKPEHVPRFANQAMGTSVVVTCSHSGMRLFMELSEKPEKCKCFSRLKPSKDAKTAEQRRAIVECEYDDIPPMTKDLQLFIRNILRLVCEFLEEERDEHKSTVEVDSETKPPKTHRIDINLPQKHGSITRIIPDASLPSEQPSTSKMPIAEKKSSTTKTSISEKRIPAAKKPPVEKRSSLTKVPAVDIKSPTTKKPPVELQSPTIKMPPAEEQSPTTKMPPIELKSPTTKMPPIEEKTPTATRMPPIEENIPAARDPVSNQLLSQTLPFASHSSPSNLNAYSSHGYGERSPRSKAASNREKVIRLLEKAISVLRNYKEDATPEEESFKFVSAPDIYPKSQDKSPSNDVSARKYVPALRPSFPPKHKDIPVIMGKKIELKRSTAGSRLPCAKSNTSIPKPASPVVVLEPDEQ